MDTLLIIDDDANMRDLLTGLLATADRQLLQAASATEGLALLSQDSVDLVLTDIHMPDMSGIEFIKSARNLRVTPPIITITAYASTETAIQALRAGAYDYLSKPFANEELLKIVDNTLQAQRLFQEVTYLRGKLDKQYRLENIIGQCPAMQRIFEVIQRISHAECSVLVTGPSGTGKELVARAIHTTSGRKDKPFVPINCASIPEALLESELFGHVKGAFTGAIGDKPGLIETAHTGTLFLDEIGDMPLPLQSKLLRVLQDRQIQKVGGTTRHTVDIRIIAATNQNLHEKIAEKSFRKDLYYRLNVIELQLPTLRDRDHDVDLLARHFLKQFSRQLGRPVQGFSPCARKAIDNYPWPGNVRELENAVEHAVTLCQSSMIELQDLPGSIRDHLESTDFATGSLDERVGRFEQHCLRQTLDACGYDFPSAAQQLGISLATLYRKAKKYQLPVKHKIVSIPASSPQKPFQPELFDTLPTR